MDREVPLPNVFDGESPLHVAVRSCQVEGVRKVLDEQVVDVNCLNSKRETPLHLVCSLRHTDIVVLLLAFGADPFIKDSDGDIAYHRCSWETVDLMNKMVHHNDLWINDPTMTKGDTPLHTAVRQGDWDSVQRLIQQNIVSVNDMNICYETPLHLACALGYEPIVHLLATNGADMYKRDCYNNAPIHRAVAKGHVEVVNLLTSFSCDPKVLTGYQGRTLLHFASAVGNIELINTTIEVYEINPLAADAIGKSPLHIAACHGQEEVVSLLITKYNIPVDCRSSYNFTPLHLACYCGHISCIEHLICVHKADLSLCDDDGDTPFHKACMGGNVNVVKMLIIEYKADLSARDHQKNTPMHQAALGGHKDIVESLIKEFQRNPHEKGCDGRSLLHNACHKGHTKLAVMLITDFKLNPCLADDNGNTPLHMACWYGYEELARLLITKYNCPVDVKNKQNETPLHNACLKGHINVVKMLLTEFGVNLNENDTPFSKAVLTDLVRVLKICSPEVKGFAGRSLFNQACDKGHTEIAVVLITELKLSPYLADYNGNTPLHIACGGGHEELARLLISKYNCPVDVENKQYETPLHKACLKGHINVVKMLAGEYKANLSACNHQERTPMHLAALGGHKDIVESLINEFQCNPHEKAWDALAYGRSILHNPCHKRRWLRWLRCLDDDSGSTPLHMACLGGHEELARLLITKYNCPVDVKDEEHQTPLHTACFSGHINVVKMLIKEYNADSSARNYEMSTPMHQAALGGHKDIVETLITEFQCNPHEKGYNGRSLLHNACYKGHTKLAVMLITEFQLDKCLADDSGNTPLHLACLCGHEELARLLITKYNCPVDVKNKHNATPLYLAFTEGYINVIRIPASDFQESLEEYPLNLAIDSGTHVQYTESGDKICIKGHTSKPFLHQVVCGGGSASMLRELIINYGHDPACVDDDGNTVLHTAAQCGKDQIVQMLAREYSCSCRIDGTNLQGQTPLHCACIGGHVGVVKSLLSHKASVYITDTKGYTPIKCAHLLQSNHVLFAIFRAFGFCSKTVDSQLFHKICVRGTIEFIGCLLSDFKLDPSTLNDRNGNSLLHTAVLCGRLDMARCFLEKCKLDVECRNSDGQTPLHLICSKAPANSVEGLLDFFVHECKADVMCKDKRRNQPIHVAVKAGRTDVVIKLISNYNCDATAIGYKQRTLLHHALVKGFTSVGKVLIDDFNLSVHCTDDDGNTPLHLSSLIGQHLSVRLLLYDYHVPVFVRNKAGKTAFDLAKYETIKQIFREYTRSEHKRIQEEYEKLRSLSLRKYPGKQKITRIFVLGNVGSGKSTLIKSIKTKGYISYWFSVSDVPPHTAGIIPSLYESKETERFLCYDFAGDKEYYSSHSAILEIVTQSSVGTSVYVIVANLTKELSILFKEIGYWLSFISYHAKMVDSAHKLKSVIVLSHSDRLSFAESSSKSDNIKQYFQLDKNCNDKILDVVDVVTSDCRKPYSSKTVEDTLQRISRDTNPCNLSFESTLLHGLLEKDFRNVVACKLQDIVNHVKDTGIYLPAAAVALHPIVKELHDIGLLMMIGRSDEPVENHLLLLNPCALTNEVHQNLFSMEAKQKFISTIGPRYANMGIMPESLLHDILPEHISKECLIQLQYCQEFSHTEVGLDYTVTPDASESKENLLYFPALCNLQTESANWSSNPDLTFSMGWYVKCNGVFNYFPARFLHVVLLRLAFSLALPMASCSVSDSVAQTYRRRCTMWKNGIHWLMEEGVECTFEMVDDNKGIVAVTRAKESCKHWATILGKIVNIALKAKTEFCDAVTMHQFLLNSADPLSFKDEDKLFDMNDVRRVLKEGKENVVSVGGNKLLDSSCLSGLKGNTYWGM